MRTWLKRMVAGIVSAGTLMSGGLLTAGTANADEIRMPDIGKTITSLTASAATTYPRELVNGGFDYLPDGGWKTVDAPSYMTNAYTSVDPNNGQYMRNAKHSDADLASWVDWPGFDQSKFAWKTDQKGGHDQGGLKDRAEAVELQQDSMDGNTYAEMVASEPGRTIYQNLATIPGTLYKIRLKHASLCKDNVDQMQVVINGTPIEMTRVAANGKAGDKVGEKSKTIGTRVTNGNRWHHSDQWETYEGYYVIPDGQTTTRFGFKAVNYLDPTKGNLLDDVTFARAYKLSYDKNASDATGKVPSDETADTVRQTKARTTGTVKTVADENVRYGSLANGDFSYPSFSDIQENEQGTYADLRTFLKSDDGTLWYNMSTTDLSKYGKIGQIPGFDSSRFAWSSTENGSRVELQQDRNTKNTYAEIVAQQDNTSIYQNVSTGNGGVLYKIRLKHASRQSSHADKMQVLVGSDTAHATPVEMTRVTSNGHGDKVGGKSTTITTKVSNTDPRDHGSQWETYEGYYQVPEGQKNTVFMFKSLEGFKEYETLPGNNVGNLVDDIEFSRSYKLTYDKNASDATGKVPSNQRGKENTVQPAKAKTTGSVGLAADKTASGLTVHDLKKNDKGKVPSSSKADSTQPAAFKAPDAKVETIASRAAGDELAVNGGFDTPKWTIAKEGQGLPWVYVTPNEGMIRSYAQAMAGQTGVKSGGLTAATFAWQDVDATGGNQNFELHRERDGNTAADVHAGRTVAQTVATTPGATYTFGIRHSGRSKGNAGGVTLLAGPDKDHLTPVKLTRTTVSKTGQKYGDKTGDVGTVAYTHSDSMDATEGSHEPWDHSDDWESYEGTVIIPAGQSRTMIAYRGVAKDGKLTASANDSIIDDLSFRLAYKLSYDANGGDKTDTSQIKASSDGTVKSIAGKTSKVPVHDLEDTDVPGQYRDFILDTTKVKFSDVKFENGAWLNAPMPDSGDGATAMFPLKIGASATLPNVGEWTDGSGHTHSINAIISLHSWNGGSISRLWTRLDGQPSTSRDLFWINTVGRNSDLPAQVIKALGGIDTSKRVGCQWTVNFTYEDGTPVPDTFRGVTGFNDLDGWDVQPDLKFEGVQLVSGFDGAYKTRDAELATYGINGFAGVKHDSGPESNLDGKQQFKHRLAATWTGSSFTFGYDLQNPEGRDRGCRMTFGVPVTRTKVLTYDANGGKGSVPSHTEAGKVEAASAKTAGSVHAISDTTDTTGSAEGKAVSGVLTDTTVDAGDGTRQRTITRSDGSVQVQTIADTGAVSGCQVYYPAGAKITLATAKADSDCWDSSQISRTNRTFYGWSANTDANDRDVPVGDTMDRNTLNANVRTEIVMPARAKTVYALWAINPTLSYNVNAPAGSNAPGTPASQTVPYNTAAADKSGWAAGDTGKIPGYRFDGWYTAPNGGNKYDFNTPLTNNMTVYAHWIGNGYTVRFTGNGATGGNTPDQAFQYNIGQNLHRNGFTRDGYTFTGWKRADNQQAYGDGQWVTNLTTQPNGIVTMVAQWSANEAHIRYNPNPPAGKTAGGNGTPNWDGHTGDTPAIGGNGWTIDGYTFAGWTTSPDGGGTKYAPGASWTANGTLTLYAQWTPGEAGLTYDGNGATGGKTDPQNGVTDQKVNVRQNGFTRDGYTFVTWNTQADCKGNAVKPNSEWTLRGSSTLYACWAGVAQTLTYHGNGATGGNTAAQSGHTGDELTTNANGFTRDGYTFVRWDTAKDGSGTAYGEGKNGVGRYTMKPAGNDLYAIWQANPASIRYRDDWGATGSTPDTTGVTGQNVTIAQNGFTRPGYTFTGWARDRRTNPSLQPGGRYTLTPGTTTLWAQWKADPAHLIYNANTGSTSQTRRTDGVVDQTLTVIANPFTRTGYTFTGWNTQADGRGRAYAAGNGFRLVADAKSNPVNTSVLYAQWRINRVTLKFDPNGGTGGYPDITADAFTTVTIPADAKEPKVQRPGFRFTGWAMKPTPGAGDTILSPGKGTVSMPDRGSITVYAQWAPAMTTLPFTGGQAQVPTIWLYAGFALMLIALGVMMPMLRMRMAATKRTGKHMPITGGKHAK
ncbi:surface protein [Bifidobacterium longum subsp. longum]|uniref:InlB B-repeat-containing protein n=1 Tax=Bifidobacterium longum TaxID=216816 RepID=UPI0010F3D6A5|nr:InlB B-repeat-containing protein [Bifidobacterium longum]TCE63168.1 surface protein [Bifidobacterium longum subsp. longum]